MYTVLEINLIDVGLLYIILQNTKPLFFKKHRKETELCGIKKNSHQINFSVCLILINNSIYLKPLDLESVKKAG